jgi:hypothetical protein
VIGVNAKLGIDTGQINVNLHCYVLTPQPGVCRDSLEHIPISPILAPVTTRVTPKLQRLVTDSYRPNKVILTNRSLNHILISTNKYFYAPGNSRRSLLSRLPFLCPPNQTLSPHDFPRPGDGNLRVYATQATRLVFPAPTPAHWREAVIQSLTFNPSRCL